MDWDAIDDATPTEMWAAKMLATANEVRGGINISLKMQSDSVVLTIEDADGERHELVVSEVDGPEEE